jgi:hypothetical protein
LFDSKLGGTHMGTGCSRYSSKVMGGSEIMSRDEKIRRLEKLRQNGVITDEDFNSQKKRILEEF